jgi:ADP-heptose:LPS heptosyltransferase
MNISVRMEGGIGDCLLANRFVFAIKDKYPDSKITAYIDSEGQTFQKEALEVLYPNTYTDLKIIPQKKYKELWITSQFGEEINKAILENVPDDIRHEMEFKYDKFYDLHIDSLKWTEYDFDWLRYFYFFPKPELVNQTPIKENYIVLHLVSSGSMSDRLESWYIDTLIFNLHKILNPDYKIFIISKDEIDFFYDKAKELNGVEIFKGNLKDISNLISGAKLMIGVDSGFKYIGYGYGVPTLTLAKNCFSPFNVTPSHHIRWLPFPTTCFPLNYDVNIITKLSQKILEKKANIIIPHIDNFDLYAVNRKYSINLEKTKE